MLVQNLDELRIILDLLTDAVGGAGPFNAATVHLYQNDFSPHDQQVLAEFTEADFDGYAASGAVTWNPAIESPTNEVEIFGDTKVFSADGNTTPNTIYGYFLKDSGGTKVVWAERFASPVQISDVGQGLAVVPKYTLGQPV